MRAPGGEGGPSVCDRGRFVRLALGLRDHVRTAWWGLVSPHVSESAPLLIVQAAILRSRVDPPCEEGSGREEVLLAVRSELFGWELPGGTPEPGEPLEAALVREVFEETGLVVSIEREVGRWVRHGFRPHTAVVYRCRPVSGELAPSRETPRLRWFEAGGLPTTLFPWFRGPLASALAPAAPPVGAEEWQGLAAIWAALRIDLALRWRGLD